MSAEIETMAYANAVPWHGLGQRVDDCVSVDDTVEAAGLDWTVEQHPVYADVNGERVNLERQALVRSYDQKIMTVTGPHWKQPGHCAVEK